jgi:hypothetical protein
MKDEVDGSYFHGQGISPKGPVAEGIKIEVGMGLRVFGI